MKSCIKYYMGFYLLKIKVLTRGDNLLNKS